jgi:hypothetical protein
MLQKPVKRVEKRQRFHMRPVALESVAILLFTSIAVFMVLAIILAPVILLCFMRLEEYFLGQWGIARFGLRDHVPHAILNKRFGSFLEQKIFHWRGAGVPIAIS